ncbi:MAG: hypothetical protein C0490_28410, partial [Marivirga sp.]|nr:hypothetical protein [Marivirga sp.]
MNWVVVCLYKRLHGRKLSICREAWTRPFLHPFGLDRARICNSNNLNEKTSQIWDLYISILGSRIPISSSGNLAPIKKLNKLHSFKFKRMRNFQTQYSDHILTVTLSRPKALNALNFELMDGLREIIQELYQNN